MTDKSKKNPNIAITEKGSLGLLALGDIGLREWRKVKKLSNREKNSNEEE